MAESLFSTIKTELIYRQRWASRHDAEATWSLFEAQPAGPCTVPFPDSTYTVATPSGGTHLYFRQPSGAELRNTPATLGWRIDTRGHGGSSLGGRYPPSSSPGAAAAPSMSTSRTSQAR